MNEIAKLAAIVTSRGMANMPILDLNDKRPTKEMKLIALVKNPELTQNQLVKSIYGKVTPSNTTAFYQLRSRVTAKLLNHLYFLDHSDPRHLVSRRHELNILAILHQATVLMAEADHEFAELRLRRCLHLAQQDEFPVYAVLAARQLCTLYVMLGKLPQFRVATKQLTHWQQILSWEDEAEALHNALQLAVGGTVAAQRRLLPKLQEYIARLEQLHQEAKTFNTFFHLYRARLYQQEMLGDFEEIIRITTSANQQLEAGQLNARRFDKRFNLYMMAHGYLGSRQARKGMELARQHLSEFHQSSTNWFAYQENHFLLALHAEQFDYAQQVLKTVTTNAAYLKQRASAKQRWDLYREYLGMLLPTTAQTIRKPVAQWALALPDFSRDKRGYHVAVLIVQLLYFLQRQDLDEVTVRLERLRKYQTLHLREEEALRSRLFLQLLAILGKWDFKPRVCAEKGAALLHKLQQAPVPGQAFAQMEIVPYESLWALVLRLLR